ncbi:MAG: DMT family transporter [Patescibacteria group bacterium]|jgi:drug/metabolite transporter (DMT)-like permease
MQKKLIFWYLVLIVNHIFWGTQVPALKAVSGHVSLPLLTFLRFFMAMLALLPFYLLAKDRKPIERKDMKLIAFLGFFGVAVYAMVNVIGIKLSTAVNQAIILHSWPLMTAILAPLLIKERVGKGTYLALLLGFTGLIIVVTEGNLSMVFQSQYFLGNLLIFLSALILAIHTIYSKNFNHKYGSLNINFIYFLLGSFFLFLFTFFSGDLGRIISIDSKDWLLIFWVGVPTIALTWVISFRAMREIGIIKANSFFLLNAPSGVFFSVFFLHEAITPLKLFGAGLIFLGLYIVQTRK